MIGTSNRIGKEPYEKNPGSSFVHLFGSGFGLWGRRYWVGGQARKQHDLLIAQINALNYLDVSNKSYERGLFSSTALTTFTVTQPGAGDSIKFSLINSIHHGPFVFLESPHLKGSLQPVLAIIRTRLAPGDCSESVKEIA